MRCVGMMMQEKTLRKIIDGGGDVLLIEEYIKDRFFMQDPE
jgi:hypothetical protein